MVCSSTIHGISKKMASGSPRKIYTYMVLDMYIGLKHDYLYNYNYNYKLYTNY